MDHDALSETQRQALEQLQALTNGGDVEVARSVLQSVDWDVQRAADVVFGSSPSAPLSISKSPSASTPTTRAPAEPLEVDDSEQHGLLSGRPSGREFPRVTPSTSLLSYLIRPLRLVIALLAVPYTILRVVFRTLHIPIPLPPVPYSFSLSGLGLSFGQLPRSGGSSAVHDGKTAAERWVRALEEETGCMSVSRAQGPYGEASGAEPSSSSALNRRQTEEQGARVLPDFFIGSYEAFARTLAKDREARIGVVVLVSEEHDDVAEFKRSTLTDPEFVQLIEKNEMLIWGGDIRYRDVWSAAQKLQATTYPFVAFLALQPRRGASHTPSQKTVLTVLSRHQGPSIPQGSGPTSSQVLKTHITEHLVPRVSPVLSRIRQEAAEKEAALAVEAETRERERALRAEQDRAFAETARRDKERIERKIAEERRAREEAQRRSLEEERAREEAAREEEERRRWEARRMAWRRWGRRALVPREPRPGEQGRGRTLRVGVRMPDGQRAVRFFGENDSVTAVFAFVDALFIPKEMTAETDPVSAPEGGAEGEAALLQAVEASGRGKAWWGFKLATVYPRKEVVWAAGKRLGEVEVLKNGSQLVVELEDEKGKGKARASLDIKGKNEDSDEYETESD